ncbi:Na/Pi cotransporter family protein [Albimonas pacifica]|nr:Na/Pi symporter [Albimonas pacifica]
MTGDLLQALGGLGLFLLGMSWMTESLRALSGPALRGALARFTRTPLGGAATGAAATAVLQSSSAVTVTAVGFVGAGLLTFPQALGVIFGANVGTTATGWIVALLGFKMQLGAAALPLVLAGALLRLYGGARAAQAGSVAAGFALLFIGIDAMQAGMAGLEPLLSPADLPGDDLAGRLKLVAFGVALTVVTQSSSAGVATALAALGAGAISLEQAAAMVIGMDVGTTATAALATLGRDVASRRTGLSHVVFNLATGAMAFALLDLFARAAAPMAAAGEAQVALVAFHTGFNVLGVALVLPVAGPFARLVEWLIPDRGPRLTRRLSPALLAEPALAMDAAAGTLEAVAQAQSLWLAHRLDPQPGPRPPAEAAALGEAIAELRGFVDGIVPGAASASASVAPRLAAALHALDHLGRLHYRCAQLEGREGAQAGALSGDARLRTLARALAAAAREQAAGAGAPAGAARLLALIHRRQEGFRTRALTLAAEGRVADAAALAQLDALRWLRRTVYHLHRIEHHLGAMRAGAAPASAGREAARDVLED